MPKGCNSGEQQMDRGLTVYYSFSSLDVVSSGLSR
jgi:hypothetical protein